MFEKPNGKNGTNGHNGNGGSHNGNGNHKHNGNGHTKITSLIGPGVVYRGTLTGEAGVRIDGTFDGQINILGPLVITETGKVTAEEIRAGVVSVAGSVRGNIIAQQVEILSGGKVWGDVITAAFATEEGAYLRGQVKMLDEVPA